MNAITVDLDDIQMRKIAPAIAEINEAADAGHPGMLLAQVLAGRMRVFVINEEQALAFANLLGVGVRRPAAAQERPRDE